jgi:hypothetical protein
VNNRRFNLIISILYGLASALLFVAPKPLSAGEVQTSSTNKTEIPPEMFYREADMLLNQGHLKTVTPKVLAGWLKKKSVVLIDLRSKASYDQAHLRGAVNVPATELTDETLKTVVPTLDTRIVVYCDDTLLPSRRIALTTLGHPAIFQLGYKNVYRLEDLWSSPDCQNGELVGGSINFGCPSLLPMEPK